MAKPLTLDHDDLTRRFPLEERILRYALRGGMVDGGAVDWFSAAQIRWRLPNAPAMRSMSLSKEFMHRNKCQASRTAYRRRLKYPYAKDCVLDQQCIRSTLMTVGVYGKALPPQNGAPVRLIVPWKYGFRSNR
ncbi:molybdopterin-dependent oxidoreductase [Shigella flexneri]